MEHCYGEEPQDLGAVSVDVQEFMTYLDLPVVMYPQRDPFLRLPKNVESLRPLVELAMKSSMQLLGRRVYSYVYLNVRKGWATPDNPLNRPGWHCDSFGTFDDNYAWWVGPSTRFAVQEFPGVPKDPMQALAYFEANVNPRLVRRGLERHLYRVGPTVVHATPLIESPGCVRQFVKVTLSDRKFDTADVAHNYLFDYDWKLSSRPVSAVRAADVS